MYLPQPYDQVAQRGAFQHQRSGHQAGEHPAGIGGKDSEAGGDNHRRRRQDHMLKDQQGAIPNSPFDRHCKSSVDDHQYQQQSDQRQFHPQSMVAERDDIGGDQNPQSGSRVKNRFLSVPHLTPGQPFSKCLRNMARARMPPMTAPTTGARNRTISIPLEERAARVFT